MKIALGQNGIKGMPAPANLKPVGVMALWLLIMSYGLLLGCSGIPVNSQNGGIILEPQGAAPLSSQARPEEGSLWVATNPNGLLADLTARNVGDIVTIAITENVRASEIANTTANRDAGIQIGVGSLFGLSKPMNSFTNSEVNVDSVLQGTLGNTSKGEGKTERQSVFTAYLTARVIQVLPNRTLVVQGRRHLRINNETEVLTLTGIVRPEDIDRNNVVASHKVAEPRMEISGVGVVSDKQRQGWLTRIIDHIWPF